MPLFHHKSDDEKQRQVALEQARQTHEADQAESLKLLQAGGIPLQARRRLENLAADPNHLFTSDLSVAEFLLSRREGLRPITQVMGSCFYHVGYSAMFMANSYFAGGEMTTITRAYDSARELALGRLAEEARLVGATAVVGVRIKRAEYEWSSDTIEYTAVGTAVHIDGAPPAEFPALTTFSGEDYWKLLQTGYGPVGVAAGNCVFYATGWDSAMMNNFWGGGWANRELGDLTNGIRAARAIAQRYLHEFAANLGAEGVVGVTIEQRQREREVEMQNEVSRTDIIFTFLTLGTAVARLRSKRDTAKVTLAMPMSGRGLARTKAEDSLGD